MMIVVVTGSRNWDHIIPVMRRFSALPEDSLVIDGGARGLDRLAHKIAKEFGFKTKTIRADWLRYGKAAGPIRNRIMLDQNPDLVIAFHDHIFHSKGTKDCLVQAMQRNIPVELWTRRRKVKEKILSRIS